MRPTLHQRIYLRLAPCPDPECECLLWGGATNWNGYGTIKSGERQLMVHRALWELEVSPIPPGLTIDHVRDHGCVHHNCANLAHLEPVTHRVNILRGPNTIAARYAARTHCDKGHAFDLANTYWRPGGTGRACRKCRNEDSYRYKRRKRAEVEWLTQPVPVAA